MFSERLFHVHEGKMYARSNSPERQNGNHDRRNYPSAEGRVIAVDAEERR